MTQSKTSAFRLRPLQSPFRVLSCIRLDEVLVLQGSPLMGALFSITTFATDHWFTLAALIAGNLCLVAYVFVLNDWAGIDGDLKDPNRAARTFVAKGVGRTAMGYLALCLLALSLLIFGMIGTMPLVLGLVIAGLGALYSAPGFHWKGMPLASSALHIGGGALHFLLGYAAFAVIDAGSVAISSFFGLVFAAGHFTHEARDYDGDKINGIRTNAVAFGKTRVFLMGLALFTAAYALLATLAVLGFVPFLLIFAAALYPFHLIASLRALGAGLTFEGFRQLQWRYRALYATIGLLMIAGVMDW
jgi:4-hydroxybenzoate polyprenyltransferase